MTTVLLRKHQRGNWIRVTDDHLSNNNTLIRTWGIFQSFFFSPASDGTLHRGMRRGSNSDTTGNGAGRPLQSRHKHLCAQQFRCEKTQPASIIDAHVFYIHTALSQYLHTPHVERNLDDTLSLASEDYRWRVMTGPELHYGACNTHLAELCDQDVYKTSTACHVCDAMC